LLYDPYVFSWVCVALAGLALIELLRSISKAGLEASPFLAAFGLLGPMSALPGHAMLLQMGDWSRRVAAVAVIVLALEVVRLVIKRGEPKLIQRLAYGSLCAIYVSLFGSLAWLRNPEDTVNGGQWPLMQAGAAAALLVCFSVWACDTFAFFVGKALGKNKLAPDLSPNKTIEGAIGGLIGAVVVAVVAGHLFFGRYDTGIVVGVITGLFGPAGDLFESAIKRELGVKDLGGLLPGHGGVLDRFDSLLFVVPVVLMFSYLLHP
jgi:phosphatidate cytidylyltransferase